MPLEVVLVPQRERLELQQRTKAKALYRVTVQGFTLQATTPLGCGRLMFALPGFYPGRVSWRAITRRAPFHHMEWRSHFGGILSSTTRPVTLLAWTYRPSPT